MAFDFIRIVILNQVWTFLLCYRRGIVSEDISHELVFYSFIKYKNLKLNQQ